MIEVIWMTALGNGQKQIRKENSEGQDWHVTEHGQCAPYPTPRDWDLLETPYHFHRFLTEVEDFLRSTTSESPSNRFPSLRRLVRKLVINSYWLRTQRPEPSPNSTAILNLYDEIGYPLTVQIESLVPGTSTSVHNHGTWGIVAILQGQGNNIVWRRDPKPEFPDKITNVAEKTLKGGDIISFVPEAIHCVQVVGEEPLVTFNLYGETMRQQRFEFDPNTHRAKHY